jgi:hypothetical protein
MVRLWAMDTRVLWRLELEWVDCSGQQRVQQGSGARDEQQSG